MFQNQIDSLTPENVAFAGIERPSNVAAAAAMGRVAAPSNAELVAQMKAYYGTHKRFIDGMADQVKETSQKLPDKVRELNQRTWTDGNKNPLPLDGRILQVTSAIKGHFDEPINRLDPKHMFTTMGVGVGIDAQFLVGGAGGVGAAWDVLQREPVTGYAYAMVEMGLRANISVNVQGIFLNQIPSQITHSVLAMKVSAAAGLGLSLTVFWNADPPDVLSIFGFATGLELGGGAGATIAYGKVWGFR